VSKGDGLPEGGHFSLDRDKQQDIVDSYSESYKI
jgi:hypothetical protein